VLELVATPFAVVRCLATSERLDRLRVPAAAHACRVASDELILLGPVAAAQELVAACSGLEADGVVIDDTDGFAAWTLSGPAAEEAFARLSAIELPNERPAFVQGAIAGVPGKALAEVERIHVLVSASLGHHLLERVAAACGDLVVSERLAADPIESKRA